MTPLYVGIDIGKHTHHAALLSHDLLVLHRRAEHCPFLSISNTRAGFETLLSHLQAHAPPDQCHVLLEHTGHYGSALEQYLQEHDVHLYRINAPARYGKQKTDKRDARALSILLYNQEALNTLASDPSQRIRPIVPPSDTALLLRGLVQHRAELVHETSRCKNKLTAICDELFPELTQVYKDPNAIAALSLRERYPTPQAIMDASLDDLYATRKTRPSNVQIARLPELARTTIGTKNVQRRTSLLIEQEHLIAALRLQQNQVKRLDNEIETAMAGSREGQILCSFPCVGIISAATLVGGIGNISNFEKASHLKAYLGWAPRESQTGTSYDSMVLARGGHSLLQQTIYLIVFGLIQRDTYWRDKYRTLVARKCELNKRTGRYVGTRKVLGRIAGDLIRVIYTLLKRDYDTVLSTPDGAELPAPELYSIEKAGGSSHSTIPHEQADN